jgi:hypothetical protein
VNGCESNDPCFSDIGVEGDLAFSSQSSLVVSDSFSEEEVKIRSEIFEEGVSER